MSEDFPVLARSCLVLIESLEINLQSQMPLAQIFLMNYLFQFLYSIFWMAAHLFQTDNH
jgi:hypothetical protein